ncbi:MAG: RAD55 family ATPase [Candidatus Aminicenantales bacterium]
MLERIATRVPNLDRILGGGLAANSLVLVSGNPGSGKTVLTNQIVYGLTNPKRKALIVTTVSEPLSRLLRYIQEFSFFDVEKVAEAVIYEDIGPYLLGTNGEKAWERMEELILKTQPAFLVIDSIRAVHDLSFSPAVTRRGFFRLASVLSTVPCTAFLISEYNHDEYNHAVEASIADVIIHLEYKAVGLGSRRIISVHKVRGSDFLAGEHTFKIGQNGITIFPRFITPSKAKRYEQTLERVLVDIPGFDDLLFPGGILRGTSTLLVGDPGVGKTVTALHFILNGALRGEPGVYVTFQEDPNQIAIISRNFGFDLEKLAREGRFDLLYHSPVEIDIDEMALKIIESVEKIGAKRLVIDSISDLASGARNDPDRFFNFIYSFVQWLKDHRVTSFLTNEMGQLFANELTLTGRGVSHIADNLLLLRYSEIEGEIRRAITALAARGSDHSKRVYEYLISEKEGPRVGLPLESAFTLFRPTTRQE